jgi:hypothetical protein
VYRVGSRGVFGDTVGKEIDPDAPLFLCGDVAGPIIYSAGNPHDQYVFPDGVGTRIPDGAVLQLESHWLNTTSKPLTNDLRVNLYFSKKPIEKEAGALFFYDVNIGIRANEFQRVKMRCQIPEDIEITDVVPHVHLISTAMRAYATPPGVPRNAVTATTSRQFLDTKGFVDLVTRRYDPPFKIHAGEYLDYECDYQNTNNFDVIEGPLKVENEMCLFVAGYYPRIPPIAELCLLPNTGSIQEPGGTLTCADALTCESDAGGRKTIAGKECWFNICEPSQDAANNFQNCVYQNCQHCAAGPSDDCNNCVGFLCSVQYAACLASNC